MAEPKSKSTPKTADSKSGFCVYLGPSIHGVIIKGTVFDTDKAATLKIIADTVKAHPLVAELIVPGERLPESRIKINTPGTLLYENYRRMLKQPKA